jgi:putative hydrolase of the HAD superfamily
MFAMFDLDNTLSERSATFLAWVAEFVDEFRLPDEASEWIVTIDADGYSARRSVFEAIRSRFEIKPSVDTLLQRYQRRIVELSRLSPGATECLEHLRAQGWKTAIVSNGSSEQQNGKVDALGLRSLVDSVIVSADVGHRKPEPAIFQLAAERATAELAGSWIIGDSPMNDIIGPARLGVSTVWIRRGRPWTEVDASPDRTIDSLTELVRTPLTIAPGR